MSNLIRLIGRRLLALPIMILGITFLVFFVMSFNPVDPAYGALGEGASAAQIEAYHEEYGLNDPLFVRYFAFLGGLLHGDLGSYTSQRLPVSGRIAEAFPVTISLTFYGLIIAVIMALIFGVLAALYRDSWIDQIIRVFSIIFVATPSFWLAVLLIQAFTINNDILPASGPLIAFESDPKAYMMRMLMPAFALGIPVAGSLIRVVRTSMVEELDKDYVRTALGAGIPKHVVVARNVLRNALITPVTVLGLRIGYLMGGAVIIEVIFALPGMGQAILEGIQSNYADLVQGVTLTVALAFVVVNIVVDMLYILINPRIRTV
ncbi:ABC transporter permease [Corynebacterium pygosceleis]|uniref:ABC transporter permease n=1 Tax=Corynebacterium pygosceleis TaxID=2800406 RepID=A0A9Q4C7H0_9CORY|nr:ABC transporter permease [Corynebacterium pygosceleis]MCK7637313.1 ABC transporter permease [Corynebacterium pygosceleis]MCK7675963.1 ABC transporter permease [Corynebacterium pygosceleis]MCL0119911.1 ABC transporter permease [Corynebacterium pygosceleis]MCX7445216.1 ABC transporter permease [Corynebacterium pygosceleis]MCX7468359.1 ABC transporter permease [Corynebacterium pygosceleis]